jgi:hypothetical protein
METHNREIPVMDYGVKALKSLIDKIDQMPVNELRQVINEADMKFNKIQLRYCKQIKVPSIKRDNYKETNLCNCAALEYLFRVAA